MQISTLTSFFPDLIASVEPLFNTQFILELGRIAFFITLLLLFVWLLTILIARNRKRSDREHHHEALVASLRTDCDRINSFLSTETQIFVSWMSL
ncbi:MAG: hypothetical protein ACKPEQ_42135, partial [Dolichospermum sp.]